MVDNLAGTGLAAMQNAMVSPATPIAVPLSKSGRAAPDLVGSTLPRMEFDAPETTDWGVGTAQFDNDTIENNYWWMYQRRVQDHRATTIGQMSAALYGGDDTAWMAFMPPLDTGSGVTTGLGDPSGRIAALKQPSAMDQAYDRVFADMARRKRDDPGRYANFPGSRAELDALMTHVATTELRQEKAEAEAAIANRVAPNWTGGALSLGASALAGVTDAEGIATLPFGAGAGTLARTMLLEALIGGGSAALAIPGQQRQAARLGTTAPDPLTEVLAGAGFGAALPLAGRALGMTVNAATARGRATNRDLLGWAAKQPNLTDAQRGAVATLARDEATLDSALPGIDPGAHAAAITAAEDVLDHDGPVMVRPSDVIPGGTGPDAPREGVQPQRLPRDIPDTETRVQDLIMAAEAPRGFDTHSDFTRVLPDKPLTAMTVDEVLAWQQSNRQAGAESSAAGGFQIIHDTLSGLKSKLDLTGREVFDEAMQRRMARALMDEAGFADYLSGTLSPAEFGNALAKVWAGLPELTGPNAGRSHYAGDGLNGATVSSRQFLSVLAEGGIYTRPKYPATSDGVPSAGVTSFNPADLLTDANAYQYKAGGDQFGVTPRLRSEREWDARAAIGVMVHERLDGTRYIADGHQRFGLARRMMDQGQTGIELQGFLYREADGFSIEDVRARAALTNIRQESGTAIDAAKILRDNPDMAGRINRSRPFMVQAQGLADLAPGPFQAVVNEVIPQNYGALVGRIIPDDDRLQGVAIATLRAADPANEVQAESIIRDIRRLGLEQQADAAQMDLFGDGFDLRSTVISERARLLDHITKDQKASRTLFTRLDAQADTIEGAGNVLDRQANLSRAERAARTLDRLLIAANQPGPIRDAIDAAARSIRSGASFDRAARDVMAAFEGEYGPGLGRRAADGADDRGAAGADVAPPTPLSDLPALGDAAIPPGLFDDPLTSPAELARVAAAERDITARLGTEPGFDMALPLGRSNSDRPGPTMSLRAVMQDQAIEADFIDQLQLICKLRG